MTLACTSWSSHASRLATMRRPSPGHLLESESLLKEVFVLVSMPHPHLLAAYVPAFGLGARHGHEERMSTG